MNSYRIIESNNTGKKLRVEQTRFLMIYQLVFGKFNKTVATSNINTRSHQSRFKLTFEAGTLKRYRIYKMRTRKMKVFIRYDTNKFITPEHLGDSCLFT